MRRRIVPSPARRTWRRRPAVTASLLTAGVLLAGCTQAVVPRLTPARVPRVQPPLTGRAVVPRWTALGVVLGLATPLALRAVGADRPGGKDLAAGAALGAGAGAVTGAVMCRQARAG
jgi:hypothetical protein